MNIKEIEQIIKTSEDYPAVYTKLEVELAKEAMRLIIELDKAKQHKPTPYLGFEG